MNPAAPGNSRLAYIDWMRGLACVLMFQTHCYDAWLSPEARRGDFYMYSQLGGTFPAPLFLFLAGISFALVTDKLRQKKLSAEEIARSIIWRGFEILLFGMLFRLQEYVIAWGWAPWTDLLRVDVLNTIGASMMLMGVMCWLVLAVRERSDAEVPSSENDSPEHRALIATAATAALLISFLTPLLWTTWRLSWLPWPIESYIDGVHNLGAPQSWLFPLFPWAGFAFAGLATGFLLQSKAVRERQAKTFFLFGAAGLVLVELARVLDRNSYHLYATYDYWHTSPNFFWLRVGMLLVILYASYAWCRWGAGQWGFSPLIQLGQASLLVYWVHLEFVYGRVSIVHKRAVGIGGASLGLLAICLTMLALAYVRTHWKSWNPGRLRPGKLAYKS